MRARRARGAPRGRARQRSRRRWRASDARVDRAEGGGRDTDARVPGSVSGPRPANLDEERMNQLETESTADSCAPQVGWGAVCPTRKPPHNLDEEGEMQNNYYKNRLVSTRY